jgi:hypothetical protein
MLTENPEKWRIRPDIDLFMLAIYYEGYHCGLLTKKTPAKSCCSRKAVTRSAFS